MLWSQVEGVLGEGVGQKGAKLGAWLAHFLASLDDEATLGL